MAKDNHHFVPQFYLRFFASDRKRSEHPKRINLYNIKNKIIREDVSIRKQCYKRKLYGGTDALENALGKFESTVSNLFSLIINLERLPPKHSIAYFHLTTFVVLQHLRTKTFADLQNKWLDSFWKSVLEEDIDHFSNEDWEEILGKGVKPLTKDELENYRIGMKDPAIFSLTLLRPETIAQLDDLEPHIVLLSGSKRFCTSDNPVVFYNQRYQWMKEHSNIGLLGKGLQLFFPISPQCMMILYDRNIYGIQGDQSVSRDISDRDLQALNLLQLINADENIYFDRIENANDPGQRESTMLITARSIPNIKLDLSFLKIKRSIKKIPRKESTDSLYRENHPDEINNDGPPSPLDYFVRRKNKK